MLLQKDRGHTDQNGCDGKDDPPAFPGKCGGVPCCRAYRKRSHHMNGRTYIGIGIKFIKSCHEPGQQIIPLEYSRTQILTVREQQVDHNGGGICNRREKHQPPEGFFVIEQRIQVHPHKVYKPEHIRDYKPFAERNPVVQRVIHHIIGINRIKPFRIPEQDSVNRPEDQPFQVGKRGSIQF